MKGFFYFNTVFLKKKNCAQQNLKHIMLCLHDRFNKFTCVYGKAQRALADTLGVIVRRINTDKMNYTAITQELSRNRDVFKGLLAGLTEKEYLWKPNPDKWCLLEIICHLCDEEREDFRARIRHILETPSEPLPSIDPSGWVQEREYMKQNYVDKLDNFLKERAKSVEWLQSLQSPKWDNAYEHPKFGRMTAKMFLSNWLAHDYLHIRQILRLKFNYLQELTNETLTYAGEW